MEHETWEPVRPPEAFSGVRTIVIVTVVMFVVQHLAGFRTNDAVTDLLALSAYGVLTEGRVWQLLTYQLLHANVWHILLNMVMLFSFGRELERRLGTRRFVQLYAWSGVLGGIGWLVLSEAGGARCIGASGAVLGVAAAFAALETGRRLSFVIFPIPWPITMTARNWVLAYGGVTVLLLIWSQSSVAEGLHMQGNIAHAAHLLGGVTGYLYGRHAQKTDLGGAGRGGTVGFPEEPAHDPVEVDRILEKIRAEGMQSLTERERDVLEQASRRGN
ncbi:MAG: rhomboid family intramembrane serine protease [Verrucomicrobia bacterium]|nr:rhomboid family intramembrane serine protease [Verrucomicrobiota bacterium]